RGRRFGAAVPHAHRPERRGRAAGRPGHSAGDAMSTATTGSSPTAGRIDPSAPSEHAPSLLRLARVELRKMVDTRSGGWLLIAIAAIGLLVLGVIVFAAEAQDRTLYSMMQAVQLPLVLLLPVLGVLAATSEWGQRTVLAT